MNFFLDENFPRSVTTLLEGKGFKVFDIRATEYEGANDKLIFKLAQKEQAILLTTDRDFFHTIPSLFDEHYGVIVIALRQPNRRSITEKLTYALTHFDMHKMRSKTLLLRDNSYHIYPDDI